VGGAGWRTRLREFRVRVRGALRPRRTVCSRGLRFTLPADNWITYYRWQSFSTKEPATLDWIDAHMSDGETLFDIGANIGLYTIYAALRHPGARIVAFEPEYANLHLLRDNIMENGIQDRVQIYSVALSRQSGLSALYIQDATPGAALHTESREPIRLTRSQRPVIWREGVYTLTLDEFCEATGLQPQCLKIDVDGTEAEILEGATDTLRSSLIRSLILEMPCEQVARKQCEALLRSAGWQSQLIGAHDSHANTVWVRSTNDRGT